MSEAAAPLLCQAPSARETVVVAMRYTLAASRNATESACWRYKRLPSVVSSTASKAASNRSLGSRFCMLRASESSARNALLESSAADFCTPSLTTSVKCCAY